MIAGWIDDDLDDLDGWTSMMACLLFYCCHSTTAVLPVLKYAETTAARVCSISQVMAAAAFELLGLCPSCSIIDIDIVTKKKSCRITELSHFIAF